ncbi:MAG: hypoxanthine phosphoribosyltransferase [Acidobacteriota bacterium]|nr:hypoxanthine phosphoribosyltransferase [Acidobacteriota bacterium]MDH3528583.1 hypoxanthine phosphoribosyltransferase [Acidobacteriota bacterium]
MFTEEQIGERVREIGRQITRDYEGRDLVLVGVLKGSCVFLADLMREIDLPLAIDFMAVASYKDGTVSTGDVEILKDLTKPIRGKDVIVVEDIIDTGLTLTRLLDILGSRGANSIKLATFLDKPDPRVNKKLDVEYCGFEIPNEFVVGYGLDVAGRFRNLPFIGVVTDPEKV